MLGTALFLLIVLLALSVPVAAVMGVLGLALNQFYASMPLYRAMGDITWNSSSEYILIAIPMFVMLGEVLLRSGIAVRVYNAIAKWLSWLPGGLMHANIGTCAIFAATSGSSVATAATVGVVALRNEPARHREHDRFVDAVELADAACAERLQARDHLVDQELRGGRAGRDADALLARYPGRLLRALRGSGPGARTAGRAPSPHPAGSASHSRCRRASGP